MIRAAVILGAVLVVAPSAHAAPPACDEGAADETLTVDAASDLGARRPLVGFLHGNRGGTFPAATAKRIAALRPSAWKVATPAHYRLARSLGAEVMVAASDTYFQYRSLYYPWNDPPTARGRFDDWAAWTAHLRRAVDTAAREQQPVAYWYPLNEPLVDRYTPEERERLLESYRRAHHAIKDRSPEQKIAMPGAIGYSHQGMSTLLAYVERHAIVPDAWSWHEFGRPESILEHATDFRALLRSHPMLGTRPLVIDEYQSEAQHLLPGFSVGWLHYLEAAGVAQAMRACWELPKPGGKVETCWTGLNGLFVEDESAPTAVYWTYERYARMTGRRLRATSSAPHTIAAVADRRREAVQVLIGRFERELGGPPAPPRRLRLTVDGLAGKQVAVEVQRIPYDGPDQAAIPTALPSLPPPVRCTATVRGRRATVTLPMIADRDAYFVRVAP